MLTPPGAVATAIREPVRGLSEGARTSTPRCLNCSIGGIEMLDFQAEMRTSSRPRRRRLHHLDERVAVDLKVREIGRAVRLAKRKRLAKSHLPAVEIDGAFVVGHAHRDVIEPDDAPLLREARLNRDADEDAGDEHT